MPILDLLGDSDDADRILACMYCPDNPALWDAGLSGLPEVPIVSRLRVHGVRDEALEVGERGWRGTNAGNILVRIALMQDIGQIEPSVRKAIDSLVKHAIELKSKNGPTPADEGDKHPIPTSGKSIWNAWQEFRPVAHLWAAHAVAERAAPFFLMQDALRQADFRQTFLGYAEWYLAFAQDYRSRNHHADPILPAESVLFVRPTVAAVRPDATWLADDLRSELAGYRAPPSLR